jgi:membrane-associated phospholipid phosphatase
VYEIIRCLGIWLIIFWYAYINMKTNSKSIKYIVLALTTLLLAVLNVYTVKALIIFGSPLLFFFALLTELILFSILFYSLVRLLASTENIIKSLAKSVLMGVSENEYVQKLSHSKSPFIKWFLQRFDKNTPFGLPLTITLAISAFFLINFLSVLITVKSKGVLTHVDARILNQIPNIRTPLQDTFFRTITMTANTVSAILLIIVTAILMYRKNQKLLACFVIFVAAGEESVTYVIKHLVQRARPDRVLSLFGEDSFSFPSGHAVRATVLFGLLAYVIFKSYTTVRARVITIFIYVLAVSLVAISRVYLGVHYPTDVWGSILLGGSLLALVIGTIEIASRYEVFSLRKITITNKSVVAVPLVLLIFSLVSAPLFIQFKPVMASPAFKTIQSVDENSVQKMPLYSETLTGARMEPINFVYVGYEDEIVKLFNSHGWEKADPSTVGNTLKALAIGFQGRQYPTAPVTPSYLNSKPENIAFEKSTELHSLRQRHHTRIWRTNYALPDGRPIWVATASFDEGIEFAGSAKLPTHHIDPNIDAERAYITTSLGANEKLVKVVTPQLGKNASGDGFFTDGKAEVIELQ